MQETNADSSLINNDFYDELKEDWYFRKDHPIALLRKENELRVPWIIEAVKQKSDSIQTILDIGCGAGFLTNALAKEKHKVSGIDLSKESLSVAKEHDQTKTVDYQVASAYTLPYPDSYFDVVCAMDVLEHVDEPKKLISEASRVLKPGGLFFFHTFNRNLFSYIFIIKGVEWCVKNTPQNLHVYPLFIRPKELNSWLQHQNLKVEKTLGFQPKIFSKAFLSMLFKREVPDSFRFTFCKSTLSGYCGFAKKN